MTTARSERPGVGLLVILLLSFGLKLSVLFAAGDIRPVKDERNYLYAAQSISNGNGIAYAMEHWDEFHAPPFYPYFLGLVFYLGGGSFEAKIVQVILSTITVWLLYLIGKRWFDARAGLWGAAIAAFYPTLIAFTHYNWVETSFLLWFYCAILLLFDRAGGLHTRKHFLAAGILLGVASMCRAEVVYALPLMVVWIFTATRQLSEAAQKGALLVLGCVATLLPWNLHIYRELGGFLPITSASSDVWYLSYNAFEPGNQDFGISANEFRKPYRSQARAMVESDDIVDRLRQEKALAFQFMAENPLLCARRFFTRVVLLLNPTSFLIRHVRKDFYKQNRRTYFRSFPGAAKEAVVLMTVASYMLMSVLALIGLVTMPAGRPRSLILLLLTYFVAIYGLTYAMSRYRLSFVPLLMLAAGYAIANWRDCLARLRSPKRAVSAAVGLILLCIVWSVHFDRLWHVPAERPTQIPALKK